MVTRVKVENSRIEEKSSGHEKMGLNLAQHCVYLQWRVIKKGIRRPSEQQHIWIRVIQGSLAIENANLEVKNEPFWTKMWVGNAEVTWGFLLVWGQVQEESYWG